MRYQVAECAPVEGSPFYEKVEVWYAIEDTQTGELFQTRYINEDEANFIVALKNEANRDFVRKIKPKRSQSPRVSKVARFIDNQLFVGQKLPKLDAAKKQAKRARRDAPLPYPDENQFIVGE